MSYVRVRAVGTAGFAELDADVRVHNMLGMTKRQMHLTSHAFEFDTVLEGTDNSDSDD